MKISPWLQVAVLATASFFSGSVLSPTTAAIFEKVEVNSNNFIAVAAPFGNNRHQLLIIEQLSNRQPCWSESGSSPVQVDPLLLNFDFTGICGRSTDSNGYSLRMNDEDLGLNYILRIVERNGELVLLGTPRVNRSAPEIEIGSTQGMSNGFTKIMLNPGWRFTRRAYQGKALGHIYLTNDSSAPAVARESSPIPQRPSQPLPSNPPERELIFTKPGTDSTTPSLEAPSAPTPSSPSTPQRQIPVFTVPTTP